jgi:hypothetical protein
MTARVLCCGIFEREMGRLDPGIRSRIEPAFLDSMLHMRPALLEARLAEALGEAPLRPTVVVYGDCCPHMRELVDAPGLSRTEGVNCVEIALGPARFKELRRGGAFFFMPEWVPRWREVFAFELGFEDPDLARTFMLESARVLVYIDTGCAAIPSAELEDIGRYFALPVRVERPGLGGLESAIRASLEDAIHAG